MSDRLLVVGAGFSGLTAACLAQDAGLEVTLVEARPRVGGRVVSEKVGEDRFCFGAQWIGPTQHRMHRLVKAAGATLFPTWHEGTKILEVGGRRNTYRGSIPSVPWVDLLELQWQLYRVDRWTRLTSAESPGQGPAAWDTVTLQSFLDRQVRSPTLRGMLAAASRVVYGTEPAEISLLRFLSYARSADGLLSLVETPGGAQQDRVVEGTAALAEGLARRLGHRLRLDWPVTAVVQDQHQVEVRGPRGSLRADRVILALPPHLAGRLQFEPALPARTDQWLQRFPMGATTKVVVTYDRPFWREAGFSGEVVCDRAPFSVIVDNTTAEGRPALLGFVVGKAARDLAAAPPAERQRQTLAALVHFFGPAAGQPRAWGEKSWADEVFSGGCPTGNPIPGALSDLGEVARLPFGRVHWAGTETATRWTGYMEGAVESGERAFAEVRAALS